MNGHLFKTPEKTWSVVHYNDNFEPIEYPVNPEQILEAGHWDYVVFNIEEGYANVLKIEKTREELESERATVINESIKRLKSETMTQTVLQQIYAQLQVNDPDFWNADMIRDWLIENKERFLQMEKEQIIDAYENGISDENERNLSGQFTNAEQYYNETYNK